MPTPSSRLGLEVPDGATDPADGPLSFGQFAEILDDAALIDRGNLASRPVSTGGSPGIVGRLYVVSDEGNRLDLDYGTGWITVGTGLGFAPIDDPVFTGVPEAPTAADGTDDEQIATTEFVQTALGNAAILRASYVAAETAITSGTLAVAPGTADQVVFTPPDDGYFWVSGYGQIIAPGSTGEVALFMNGTQVATKLTKTAAAAYGRFQLGSYQPTTFAGIQELGTGVDTPATDATPGLLSHVLIPLLFKAGANPDPVTLEYRYKRASGSDLRVKERHLLVQVAAV